MGWFDEQIKDRIKNDDEIFSDAFHEMSGVVMGKKALFENFDDSNKQIQTAIYDILKFYHVKPQELPLDVKDIDKQLEFFLKPNGIMKRDVTLSGKWYKDGIGPLLATTTDGRIVALIPGKISGYKYFDYDIGKYVKINRKNYQKISTEAICFYKPFPLRKLTTGDLFKYFFSTVSVADWAMIIIASLAASVVGLFVTYANGVIFGKVIDVGEMGVFVSAFVMLIGVSIAQLMIDVIKSLVTSRITTKMTVSVESAAMMRLLSLPASFFKEYSSGDLANRFNKIKDICNSTSSIILTGGLTTLFSIVYFFQIFNYAPALVVPAVAVILTTVVIFIVVSLLQIKNFNKILKADAKVSGFVFALISGIEKIKLAGAEKRSFSKWSKFYREAADRKYNPQLIVKLVNAIIVAVNTLGTMVIYFTAYASGVSVDKYMAFSVAYGLVSGSFLMLIATSSDIAQIKPSIKLIKPIMDTEPEVASDKNVVTRLTGSLELSNISFRYSESMPLVIDKLSLRIGAGQYVAIVGSTGCGKSTLMRIMLGFETPQKGAVYYDGKDINAIDLKSLRKNIGTVMQNGKLFTSDIYSNIVISAPQLSVDEAWEAAEMAGVAEDIRNMPMGMHTIISEGGGGISGGQRQRIMIARAIAPKPRILMFDEATSALDNITQKHISDSLENLKCTRIVIAHRLSTIKNCDRIIVLDKGKIVEDGKYEELIEKGGLFAELVERQRLDK
ncbi:MAG: NHLP bacteriocin export ABC transporter permease/ATPase subunit [Eubacterium sp.]|nr:NHLP bacteriocin export ABC transporter permease/ATPase subunit [Eubacterium sp.]